MNLTTFPLHEIVDGQCACGTPNCERIGKHPKIRWSLVQAGFQAPPGPHGVCTGSRSGVFVVDLDGEDGLRNWASLGGQDANYVVRTGSGGLHHYYLLPDFEIRNSASKLAKGVDIRGEGGFVVGPGTLHKSGNTYSVQTKGEPGPAPAWLLEALYQEPAPEAVAVSFAEGSELQLAEMRAKDWLKSKCEPLVTGKGQTQRWMCTVALKLVKDLKLPLDRALTLILGHARGQKPESREMTRALEFAATRSYSADKELLEELVLASKRPVETKGYEFEGVLAPSGEKLYKMTRTDIVYHFQTTPRWENVWVYNEFAQQCIARNPPRKLDCENVDVTPEDISRILQIFQHQGFTASDDEIRKAIGLVAREKSFHPVRDYLKNLSGGDPARARTWAKTLFSNDLEQAGLWVAKFGVAMIERVLNPGCRMDNTLTLVGEEGIRKSSFAQQLGGDWFQGDLGDISNREGPMSLRGKWVIEIAELAAFKGKSTLHVKDFQSRPTDRYRAFGEKHEVVQPRQCVFIATTNEYTFLEGHHGNRRPWPVIVTGRIPDFDRDLFFADMLALRATGFKHWDEEGNSEQEKAARSSFIEEHPWAAKAREYCAGKKFIKKGEFQTEVILKYETSKELKNTWALQRDVNKCLIEIGCKEDNQRIEGKNPVRVWKVPAYLSQLEGQAEEEESNVVPFRLKDRE